MFDVARGLHIVFPNRSCAVTAADNHRDTATQSQGITRAAGERATDGGAARRHANRAGRTARQRACVGRSLGGAPQREASGYINSENAVGSRRVVFIGATSAHDRLVGRLDAALAAARNALEFLDKMRRRV